MQREHRTVLLLSISTVLAASVLIACTKPTDEAKTAELEPRVESNVTPTPQTPQFMQPIASPSATPAPAPAPKLEDVRAAMTRVFAAIAAPETGTDPAFIAGDFNGDGSTDLAVITRAKPGSLKDINNELANWLLEDPRNVPIPGTNAANQPLPAKPVHAEAGDTLIAVIHGVGAQGWRSPQAKQTFLLKNAAGTSMTVVSMKDLAGKGKGKLPPLRGDAISETLGGKSGILFWTGAKYAWYQSPE